MKRQSGETNYSMKKASTLKLRLDTAEAAKMEILKHLTRKNTGSEALKYVMKEYPRFVAHYKRQAEEWKVKHEEARKQQCELEEVRNALSVLARFLGQGDSI